MLTVIDRPLLIRNFLVYDLEWYPAKDIEEGEVKSDPLKLRMCGVYDGEYYRSYKSIEEFLEKELTYKNRGKWFYGHAGGLADLSFVLGAIRKQMTERGYEVSAKFSGSSAIIVKVRRDKHVWYFIDSYWLLRDKLDNIAQWIGTEKGSKELRSTKDKAKEFFMTVSDSDLRLYNEKDCVILWKAIREFEEKLLDFGGQLQMTLASSAMYLFRRKFLSHDIPTSESDNLMARDSYFASRVEVFEGQIDNCYYYDINSSFPHAMTFPCPGEKLMVSNSKIRDDDSIFIVDCDVYVPDVYLPPTPYRWNGKVFFPVGKWRTRLTSVDFRLLEEVGGRILKIHEVRYFNPFYDLADYAKEIYKKRKNADTPFEKIFYKLLLNSLYGKFAESREKQSLIMNPSQIDESMSMYIPGVWIQTELIDIPHEHVPISSHITSMARKTLFDFLTSCRNYYYCDTDGFATTEPLPSSNELGELKLEKTLAEAYFKAPKVYRYKGDDGKEVIKAKGFSEMNREKFDKLTEGLDIEFQRMARIKEMFGRFHSSEPVEVLIRKCLKAQSMTKRFTYPDKSTRPWHIDEIHSGELAPKW